MPRRLPSWLTPALAGLIFLLTGLALLPWPGLQNDELFFSGPLYAENSAFYQIHPGGTAIPLMVMSYSGALKTWLYAVLLFFFKPGEVSVRLPVLLIGIGTIWMTWEWTRRLAGLRAANVATVLLATDTIFLMTNLFDWGPVALQHVLLMGGLLAFQQWLKTSSNRMLALAFAIWGLGMWDKALLAWPLIGMAVAVVLVFPKEVFRRIRPVPVGIAVAAFLIGAAPLVVYNIARPGETARANAKFTTADLVVKTMALRQTIDGSTLFGYMVHEDTVKMKRKPRSFGERLSVGLADLAGNHRTNWMLPAWLIGFAFSFLLWNSPVFRPLLFLLITTAVAWAQMALTKNTGAASHHVILLWPFPPVFLGIAFSAMADRIPRFGGPALAALVFFLAGENLLTTNHYLSRFIVNGGSGGWTDAVKPLTRTFGRKTASWYGIVDWGYLNAIRMLRPRAAYPAEVPLFIVDVNAENQEFSRQIGSPDFLFIQHTAGNEMFAGINERLRQRAAREGYVEKVEQTIPDRNGRPVFELFRFQKETAP